MARPRLVVAGTTDVSQDIMSLNYSDTLNPLEVTLNNWTSEAGVPGLKYSTGALLIPGARVALSFVSEGQSMTLFDGGVTRMTASFEEAKAPTITIVATRRPRQAPQAQVTVRLGSELREFFPAVSAHSDTIACKGITQGDPNIQAGTTLTVEGTGQPFARSYSISSTSHTFDLSRGYRTEFTASSSTGAGP